VLARARREPDSLVIGVDADAGAMAESSRRVAAPVRKGGLPNALFVVAAAERLPAELAGIAADVSILFPWGSLLRAALALDDACEASAGIAGLVGPGGVVRALVSVDPRDRLSVPRLSRTEWQPLADRWASHGLVLTAFEPADRRVVRESGSSWGRRLAAGRDRVTWSIELIRPAAGDRSGSDQAVRAPSRLQRRCPPARRPPTASSPASAGRSPAERCRRSSRGSAEPPSPRTSRP
jgi:16S rRNA (adenine(1408)-N(1))-methyltransferase